jgi:hypothetical protein
VNLIASKNGSSLLTHFSALDRHALQKLFASVTSLCVEFATGPTAQVRLNHFSFKRLARFKPGQLDSRLAEIQVEYLNLRFIYSHFY